MADAEEREPLLTDDVRDLMRLMGESDIAEVLIKRGNAKVHIKRATAQMPLVNLVSTPPSQAAQPTNAFVIQGSETMLASEPAKTSGVTVTAPMVGTFYAAPTPKEPPYVQVGDEVRPGDVLGIVEAMKIMNEIECEIQGRVLQILAESGQSVEYGQPLMIIDPA